jgi:hypothetical protein
MATKLFSYAKKMSLCALLLSSVNNFKLESHNSETKSHELISYYINANDNINSTKTNANSIDFNDKIEINSATNLIINKHGDPITLNGIESVLKNKVEYNKYTNDFCNSYLNSKSELLIISGHHFTGTVTFHDNKRNYFTLMNLPENPNPKILIMRGCHTVMNPEFLYEESNNNKYLSWTAEEYINYIVKFAPNIELIIGYESKAPWTKDNAIIRVIKDVTIAEKKGLKAYGNHVIGLNKKMFKYPMHEKDAKGNWTYNTNYHKTNTEGIGIAYYINELDSISGKKVWKYYSSDNLNGVNVKQ